MNSSFALHDTINVRASLPQSLADNTNKVTSQQLYPKTNLDAIELDHGPSNASISPVIHKPCNDYFFDAIEWDPGPQSACDWK